MKYIATLIFISFLGLAVFSTMALNHRMNDSVDNCIGSKVDNTPCPTNLVAAAAHHISVYQAIFNTFIPSVSNSLVLLTLLLLALAFISWSAKDLISETSQLKFLHQRLRDFELVRHKARQRFVSWLSLFELSPSI
ncbi:MAG: hypothetical protein WC657_04410 [Candidatus Paceibacterota bacterium]|jgi:hypothetical protein